MAWWGRGNHSDERLLPTERGGPAALLFRGDHVQ